MVQSIYACVSGGTYFFLNVAYDLLSKCNERKLILKLNRGNIPFAVFMFYVINADADVSGLQAFISPEVWPHSWAPERGLGDNVEATSSLM